MLIIIIIELLLQLLDIVIIVTIIIKIIVNSIIFNLTEVAAIITVILEFFNTFCSAESCNILKDRNTNRSKGLCFVKLTDLSSLNKALENNRCEHMGRYLNIE
jgi:RNA recognition motif-containing protein